MYITWSIIASFDYFEDVDCPQNVFVRNINWNLISFVVFLNRCLSLYRLYVTLIYYTWSRKYHPVRTISFIEKKHYNKVTYLLLISTHPSVSFQPIFCWWFHVAILSYFSYYMLCPMLPISLNCHFLLSFLCSLTFIFSRITTLESIKQL